MHYKNGREAKNGDRVVMFDKSGIAAVGILHDAVAGCDTCNGNIAPTLQPAVHYANLSECLRMDDAAAILNLQPTTA
jgi:hypothetical protein